MSEPGKPQGRHIRLAAVGDVLLTPAQHGHSYPRSHELVAEDIRRVFSDCDLVFGNLECTLAGSRGLVPTQPRVIATPELVRAVKGAGFNVVTVANNHMFDGLEDGFALLRDLLAETGLAHFGAGMNLEEAAAPAVVEINGLTVGFLGAVDQRSGPYQFAGPDRFGVASLDVDRITSQIRELRPKVDHLIVSVHWGEERFSIPSPVQVEQAHAFVEAGASLVLGHHPHVLQGLETWRGAPIIYSLGNFIADDVYYTDGDVLRWNRKERAGCILLADLTPEGVTNVRQKATYDNGSLAELDASGIGQVQIDRTGRALARGVTLKHYRREHLWVKTILPTLRHLHWSQLTKLRPRHFRKAIGILLRSRSAD